MPNCVNHSAAEETRPCATCGRAFCDQCLVELLGSRFCLECKAAALTNVYERRGLHSLAIVSLVVPLVGYMICVPIPITSVVGLWLGRKVLMELDRQPQLTGRSLALAGMVLSGSTLGTWLLAVAVTIFIRLSQ